MRKILLFLLLPLCIQAQSYEWVKFPPAFTPNNPDLIGYSVATDLSGNVYCTGFKDEPYVYNDVLGNQFINKYDASGNLIFSKAITGKVQTHNLVVDSKQNSIVTLKFLNFMSIGGVEFNTVQQREQHVIVKFDSQGD